jgi:hypothetical protein
MNDEPLAAIQKAFALSVYYRTLRQILPESRGKDQFNAEEGELLK